MDINIVLTDTKLVQYLDINDISSMIIDNSLNQFISSNDVIYRDLCEKYLFNINIDRFKDSTDDDDHLYLKIFKKVCAMKCTSCNSKLLNLSSGSRLPLLQCTICNTLSCGNCTRCGCMYCAICDQNFSAEEKKSNATYDLHQDDDSFGYGEEDDRYGDEASLIVSCVFCNIHYHTPCLLEEGIFNFAKCIGCGKDSCYDCVDKHMRNICNCMTSNSMSVLCDNCAITCSSCGASYCSSCNETVTCKGCSKNFCCGEDLCESCLCQKCKNYTMCQTCCSCPAKKKKQQKSKQAVQAIQEVQEL